MNLLQKLSNDSQMIFGHRVIYFATDPDKKGTDHIINEYQLYNVVCEGELKISVDGNQFPDSQIVMNQFDLNLFETFQVHVTKQQFKELFGPQRRPAKEDFLYFCDLNRMYSVDHAQQFRNFNNAAVYYKLVLKKYNKTANINFADNNIKTTVNNLTKNTTIDELFSPEISEQKEAIANKNLQEFVVERDFSSIPAGIVKFNIQHTAGELARIFVPALTQQEAEQMVDEWFEEEV
jgi:hypothetical protein